MRGTDSPPSVRPVDILLVDNDRDDILMAKKALEHGKILNALNFAKDRVEALEYLRRRRMDPGVPGPDLVLLDLNIPRMDGRELLSEMKKDSDLHTIPVIVFTTSDSEQDIANMYDLHANCYVTKPIDLEQFSEIVEAMKEFWFSIVKLP